MNQAATQSASAIDVALNVRQVNAEITDKRDLFPLWKDYFARQLIGMPIAIGKKIELSGPKGRWDLVVLDSHGIAVIDDNTLINVVDLGRNPEIRHACKECQKRGQTTFGPFYCPECREKKQPDRLCESDAQFLENKYTAYCPEHLPRCQCRVGCTDPATFECDRCHRTYSEKWKKKYPNDPLRLLCQSCYAFLFELCTECKRQGKKPIRLGKSRCAFPAGAGDERHDERLCTIEHARQWLIWGPHWRGIVLCDDHYRQLAQAAPADLLWMLVTARVPASFLRDRVTDVYRLRNIVSYVRRQELTWSEMEYTLKALLRRAEQIDPQSRARETTSKAISELLKNIGDAQSIGPQVENDLLARIRAFYRTNLPRTNPDTAVLKVTVKRVFSKPGAPQSYRIEIRAGRDAYGRSMKGLLIGSKGVLVNKLKDELKRQGVDLQHVDFEE